MVPGWLERLAGRIDYLMRMSFSLRLMCRRYSALLMQDDHFVTVAQQFAAVWSHGRWRYDGSCRQVGLWVSIHAVILAEIHHRLSFCVIVRASGACNPGQNPRSRRRACRQWSVPFGLHQRNPLGGAVMIMSGPVRTQVPIRMIGWNKRFVFMMAISRLWCGFDDETEREMDGLVSFFCHFLQ